MKVMAGDVGGTKTRLANLYMEGPVLGPDKAEVYEKPVPF